MEIGAEVGRSSPTVAIQSSFFWANYYFIKFACRDINFASLLFKNINSRAFKRVSSWQRTLFMSRHTKFVAT